MAWSIVEVARMAGVTSRTLRHYDDVGLLKPAYVGSNGYRYYESDELLRLQEIRLLRELGLGLDAIADVLDGSHDRVAALRRHEMALRAESTRLARLAETVARTVGALERGDEMAAEDVFEGFAERQARYEEQLVERYGDDVRDHLQAAAAATRGWGPRDLLDAKQAWEALDQRVLAVVRSGAAPDSAAALEVMAEHHAAVSRYWRPDAASYPGLGALYAEDPEFRARYDALDPRMAEWLRDATAAYAAARLG
jgi:MerR family transcriptional regulator, thiopeptide resistance regulator